MACSLILWTGGEEMMNRLLDIGTVWAMWAYSFAETMEMSIEGGMTGAERHVKAGESFGEGRCEFDEGAV
jgi:hypothetical protein